MKPNRKHTTVKKKYCKNNKVNLHFNVLKKFISLVFCNARSRNTIKIKKQ